MKHETSISENLVREWGPHLELGVAVKKIEQVFITNSITGQSAIFSIFFDFSHFSVLKTYRYSAVTAFSVM